MPWTAAELKAKPPDHPRAAEVKVNETPGDRNFVPPDLGNLEVSTKPASSAKLAASAGEEIAQRLPTLQSRGTFTGGKWLARLLAAMQESETRILIDCALARPGIRPATEAHYRALFESIPLLGRAWKAITIDVGVPLQSYLPTQLFQWEDGAMRVVDTAHVVLCPVEEKANAAQSWVGL